MQNVTTKKHENNTRETISIIFRDVDKKFTSDTIMGYENSRTLSVTELIKEMEYDTQVPTDLDLLYNFNASINVVCAKWLERYTKYSFTLGKCERKLNALESQISIEYKRNSAVHNGVLFTDKEIKNIVSVHDEYIELEEKISNIRAVVFVIETAMSRIKDMSYTIKNALETLKIKNYIVNEMIVSR